MGEQDSISGVWREALAIIRRYPAAVVVPGAVLGALAEAPTYLIVDRLLLDQLLTYLAAAFAYYLYLAYAEGLTTDYERGRTSPHRVAGSQDCSKRLSSSRASSWPHWSASPSRRRQRCCSWSQGCGFTRAGRCLPR